MNSLTNDVAGSFESANTPNNIPPTSDVTTSLRKRKREEKGISRVEKHARVDSNSSAELPFICNELLIGIFREFSKQGLENLLVLRSLNKEWKEMTDSLISSFFQKVFQLESLPSPYLSELSSNKWPAFYETCGFLYQDGRLFRSVNAKDSQESNPSENSSQPMIIETSFSAQDTVSVYRDLIEKYKVPSIEFLTKYRKYLSSRGIEFRPSILRCDMTYEFRKLIKNEDETIKRDTFETKDHLKEQYKELASLLTSDLIKFELTISFDTFKEITKDAEEFKSSGRLAKLLFDTKLENLSTLKLSLRDGGDLTWDWKINLKGKDATGLETLMPNLRHLSLEWLSLTEGFIKKLMKSPLLTQLESLEFPESLFGNLNSLGKLLKDGSMPNLKSLCFPKFDVESEADPIFNQLSEALSQLRHNTSLTRLETITISEPLLVDSACELLTAIGFNEHLVSLKQIEGLATEEKISGWRKDLLINLLSDKAYFPSIQHLFA